MKTAVLCLLLLFAVGLAANDPVGVWNFDDPTDLLSAGLGNDLVLEGSHEAVSGPTAANGAARIGVGSFYRCFHDIPANGGGSMVNEYSLVIDFSVPTLGQWYTFFQTNYQTNNDGDAFVNLSGIGITYLSSSARLVQSPCDQPALPTWMPACHWQPVSNPPQLCMPRCY